MKEKKGMGFTAAANNISKKEGVSKKEAGAILASSSRKNAATSSNKNLKKVNGK